MKMSGSRKVEMSGCWAAMPQPDVSRNADDEPRGVGAAGGDPAGARAATDAGRGRWDAGIGSTAGAAAVCRTGTAAPLGWSRASVAARAIVGCLTSFGGARWSWCAHATQTSAQRSRRRNWPSCTRSRCRARRCASGWSRPAYGCHGSSVVVCNNLGDDDHVAANSFRSTPVRL